MERLKLFFDEIAPMSVADWELFSSYLHKEVFPKKSKLLAQGNTEKYISFIEKGMVRYYIPKIDNDLTFSFVFENEFTTGYDSFISQSPSLYEIQALEETTVWRISFADLQKVYKNTLVGNTIGRKMAEAIFLVKAKRELDLLNKSPEEMYLELLKTRPRLFHDIPLKYIASYIGITPQALSRIRKRIT
ncbi:Crp/Fnr family transcriptional regulator [Wenyingzhuangia sp. IMCC45574]